MTPKKTHPKRKKPANVHVMTVEMGDTTTAISEFKLDMNSYAEKQRLYKHLEWALRNNHGVQIAPSKD